MLSLRAGVLVTRTSRGSTTNRWPLADVLESKCLGAAGESFLFSIKVATTHFCWASTSTLTFSTPDARQRDAIMRKLTGA